MALSKCLRTAAVSSVLMAAVNAAFAWSDTGHMLVGQIAYLRLKAQGKQATIDRVTNVLGRLQFSGRTYNLTTGGCWMDDLKDDPQYNYMKPWHYVNVEYVAGGGPFDPPRRANILTALTDVMGRLSSDSRLDTDAAKASDVGILLHLVGDIHQPLHAVVRNYDEGGNKCLVTGIPHAGSYEVKKLHAFWDGAFRFDRKSPTSLREIFTEVGDSHRPPDPEAPGPIKEHAERLVRDYPPAPHLALTGGTRTSTRKEWASESYMLACTVAYPSGLFPYPPASAITLEPGFVHTAHVTANRRLVTAGYRLAALLHDLFGP